MQRTFDEIKGRLLADGAVSSSEADVTSIRSSRVLMAWCLVLAALVTVSTYVRVYGLKADDDRIWLYYTGSELGRANEGRSLMSDLLQRVTNPDMSEQQTLRTRVRSEYTRNYLLPSVVYRTAGEVVKCCIPVPVDVMDNYPGFLAHAMVIGFSATFTIAVVTLLVCIGVLRDTLLAGGLVLALTLMAGIEWIGGFYGSYFMLDRASGFGGLVSAVKIFAREAVGLVVNPTVAFSPFGDTPRNHFILLTLTVFALRMKRYYGWSYAVVWLLGFVHLSYAGMLLGFLLLADLLWRPALLMKPQVWSFILLAALNWVARETWGDISGVHIWWLGAAALFGLGGLAVASNRLIRTWLQKQFKWRPAAESVTEDLHAGLRDGILDLAVMAGVWILTVPIFYAVNRIVGELQSIYFWSQVHGRALAMLRPGLFLVVSLAFLSTLKYLGGASAHRARLVLLAACMVVAISMTWSIVRMEASPIKRLEGELVVIDRKLTLTGALENRDSDWETVTSYWLAKTLDTNILRK